MTIFCLGFQALLTDETISNVPILILGNKIDRPEAISEDALRGTFGLHGHTTGKVKKNNQTHHTTRTLVLIGGFFVLLRMSSSFCRKYKCVRIKSLKFAYNSLILWLQCLSHSDRIVTICIILLRFFWNDFLSIIDCLSLGECVTERDEYEANGSVYVQRVKKTRIRGWFPMAFSIHRLTG